MALESYSYPRGLEIGKKQRNKYFISRTIRVLGGEFSGRQAKCGKAPIYFIIRYIVKHPWYLTNVHEIILIEKMGDIGKTLKNRPLRFFSKTCTLYLFKNTNLLEISVLLSVCKKHEISAF